MLVLHCTYMTLKQPLGISCRHSLVSFMCQFDGGYVLTQAKQSNVSQLMASPAFISLACLLDEAGYKLGTN